MRSLTIPLALPATATVEEAIRARMRRLIQLVNGLFEKSQASSSQKVKAIWKFFGNFYERHVSLRRASAIATHITRQDLKALSDDPDDLVTDIQTIAGPYAGLAGAQIYIDGLKAGDAALPSKTSIQEVRLNQNPFAPEFDAMGLGRIELLTKAGADAYHASASFGYGNDIFNSRNPYAPEKPHSI